MPPAAVRQLWETGATPPPSLPYKVDTSRPSLRTNWTYLDPRWETGATPNGARLSSWKTEAWPPYFEPPHPKFAPPRAERDDPQPPDMTPADRAAVARAPPAHALPGHVFVRRRGGAQEQVRGERGHVPPPGGLDVTVVEARSLPVPHGWLSIFDTHVVSPYVEAEVCLAGEPASGQVAESPSPPATRPHRQIRVSG